MRIRLAIQIAIRRTTQFVLPAALVLFAGSTVTAKEDVRAFVGARLIPIDGAEIEDGTLLVRGAVIEAVGPAGKVKVPKGAEVIDVSGKVILPGLVDTHSHIGQVEGGDRSQPIQPGVRVMDAIDVLDPSLQRARAGGVTTVNIIPGSGHLMSGQTIYLKLRAGTTIDELFLLAEDGWIMGGMKMANGANYRRDPPFPGTRAKSAALVRERYTEAQEYAEKLERGADDPEKMPDRDLGMEALLEVLEGRRIVHHHTHRHDDVITVLRLQEEFGFRVILHHVSEGGRVADQIVEAGVPSSIILVDSPGGKLEAIHLEMENGAIMEEAGAMLAFHTDDYITDSRLFLRMAALAVRAGMSREGALRALTLAPAEMIDLGERVGSLTPGKDADFLILSGDPLSVYTRVLETWVEGEKLFDLSSEEDRSIAEGGYGVTSPAHAHVDCFVGEGR